ncbi:MAG: thioredoxin domain-containing protein [bacterium]
MAHQNKAEGVPVPTVVISVIAVFVAGLLIGGFALRFGSKGSKDCDCSEGTAAPTADADKRYRIYPRPHNPAKGPRTAKVTVIEVSDFQCPHCRNASGTMEQILKAFPRDVRLVFMHNPLPNHPDARLGAFAAMAAHKQGKFWEYHDLLFRNPRQMKKPNLLAYAKQLGLDVAKFQKEMDDRRLQMQVNQDMQQLQRLGARGTPAFFVNGRYVRGNKPFSYFKKVIGEEIRHANKLLKSGVARAQLYREIMKTAEFRIGGKGDDKRAGRDGNKRRPPREDPNAVYKVPTEGRPFKGAKDAKVVIAEWSDYQCPWCSKVNPLLAGVLKKFPKDVKVVWFDFPLRFHKQAMPAAQTCYEVFKQKGNAAFWKCHDSVFANARQITDENLAKWAKEAGADPKKVAEAIKSKKHEQAVQASMRTGQMIGVRGTPSIVVNGRKYQGQRDPESFAKMIEAEIKKANGIIGKGGVTVATYYNHIQKTALAKVKYLPGQDGPAGKDGRRRPPRRQPDPNAIYKVTLDGKSPFKGPKHALVTIVEWSDFQCPYCKWAACLANDIAKAYPTQVKVVFKNNPLGFHKQAMPAAEAAYAALAQKGNKGFWSMHDKLFPMDKCKTPMPHIREWLRELPRPAPTLDLPLFTKFAGELGLNVAKFKKDLEAHTYQARLKEEQAMAVKLGARGTPAFFINGLYIRGVRPFDRMKQLIDEQIKKAQKLMAEKKIPLAKLYDAIIANGATAPVYLEAKPGGANPRIQVRPGGRPRGGKPGIRLRPKGQ